MRICHQFEDLVELGERLHLALGVFDGVHLGHQEVISRAAAAARRDGGLSGMVTFDPHPIRVIAPHRAPASLLATLDHKQRIVARLGLDVFVALHFDGEFAAMEAADFLRRLTAAPVKTIAVGEDWRFGRNRGGDVAFLRSEADSLGFRVEAVSPVMYDGDRISSTRIRQAIHDGNLAEASAMLGRPYSVCGIVAQGDQLGRQLGFPTANLPVEGIQTPPGGVWAVRVAPLGAGFPNGDAEDAPWLEGVANLGTRPTVGGSRRLLEVHLLDFAGDLYGTVLDVRFEKHLRPETRFPSVETLKKQIALDVETARAHFARP